MGKRSANLAKGRIVDHERHPIYRYIGVPLTTPQRRPPSPETEIVQYFDQAEARRKAQDEPPMRLYEPRD